MRNKPKIALCRNAHAEGVYERGAIENEETGEELAEGASE